MTVSSINIEDVRITGTVALAPRPRVLKKRAAQFVPGPIPVTLLRLLKVPRAFKVWGLLQARRRMGYSMRLARPTLPAFGLTKREAQRGLVELERHGLVRVERHPGKAAVIELLAVEEA